MLVDVSALFITPLGYALMWLATVRHSSWLSWVTVTQRKRYWENNIGAIIASACLLFDLSLYGRSTTWLAIRQEVVWGTSGYGQFVAVMIALAAAAPLLWFIEVLGIYRWHAELASRMAGTKGWLSTADYRAITPYPVPVYVHRTMVDGRRTIVYNTHP